MRDLLNFFDKPKDPQSYVAVKISLASPEKIGNGRMEKLKRQRPSTIGLSNQKGTAFFAPRYSVLQRITSVFVESIKG